MTDIQKYGDDGSGRYWIKAWGAFGGVGHLRLIKIDEFAKVHYLPGVRDWDDDAPTKEEAIAHFLAADYEAADKQLKDWKRNRPEPPPKPKPVDIATERWELGL